MKTSKQQPTTDKLRRDSLTILEAAIRAADAGNAVRTHLRIYKGELRSGTARLPLRNFDRIFLLAIGKAAVPMAKAVAHVLGRKLSGGMVLTKAGHAPRKLKLLEIFEAGHPIPDERGLQASLILHTLLTELNARDLLICAISGGASALLPCPSVGLSLKDKQKTTSLLLRAGANIHELNTVRKHLSRLKGGRLAALAYPATVLSLLLSDVVGDDPEVIASGLTVPDSSTYADAIAILEKFNLLGRIPKPVRTHLELGNSGAVPETPKPGDAAFDNVFNVVVGSNRMALKAAAAEADKLGYHSLLLSSTLQGETREAARVHAQILREARSSGNPVRPPACIVSGGETTVSVKGNGQGGRNQEFALMAAIELAGVRNVLALSVGTDGTDGPTDAAGAIATGDTLGRAKQFGMDARDYLDRNDSYPFFEKLGDLVKTGPTGTNVMDVHILLAK